MQLGDTIATYDVALALRGESGKFEVTSPTGEIYQVTCKPNHSISNLEWSGNQSSRQPFLIRKVSEPISLESGKTAPSPASEIAVAATPRAPFLLDIRDSAGKPLANAVPLEGTSNSEAVWSFELSWQQTEVASKPPTARICLKAGRADATVSESHWITASCDSLNELDAEIRRLHARLDDMQVQARKKFYKAQAVASA